LKQKMNQSITTKASTNKKHLNQVLDMLCSLYPSQQNYIETLKAEVDSGDLNEQSVASKIKALRQSLLHEKDQDTLSLRIATQNIRSHLDKLALSRHISAPSRDKIKKINLSKGNTASELLGSLSELCFDFADEVSRLRNDAETIVGDEHDHLKSSSANIIAGDVAWSSRQILNALTPLIQRAKISYPDDAEIHAIEKEIKNALSSSAVDFYLALNLMEATTTLLTKIQGRKNKAESVYLKAFQNHLKTMHTTLSASIKSSVAFQHSSEKEKEKIISTLNDFKEISSQQDDPDILKKMISENVEAMRSGIDDLVNKQNVHLRQQQRTMEVMQSELREQERQYETLKSEHEALKEVHNEAETLALRDPLTQAWNRRAFDKSVKKIDSWVKKHEAYEVCGLIVLDVDRFKSINDIHGHAGGDLVLQEIHNVFNQVISGHAIKDKARLFRYGGEEFVILCHKTKKSELYSFAETLRKKIASHPFSQEKGTISCTVSLGVARYSKLDRTGEAVFKMADQALYKAKESGRNRVFVYDENKFKRVKRKDDPPQEKNVAA